MRGLGDGCDRRWQRIDERRGEEPGTAGGRREARADLSRSGRAAGRDRPAPQRRLRGPEAAGGGPADRGGGGRRPHRTAPRLQLPRARSRHRDLNREGHAGDADRDRGRRPDRIVDRRRDHPDAGRVRPRADLAALFSGHDVPRVLVHLARDRNLLRDRGNPGGGLHRDRPRARHPPRAGRRRDRRRRLLRRQAVAVFGHDQPGADRRRLEPLRPHPPHAVDDDPRLVPRPGRVHRRRARHRRRVGGWPRCCRHPGRDPGRVPVPRRAAAAGRDHPLRRAPQAAGDPRHAALVGGRGGARYRCSGTEPRARRRLARHRFRVRDRQPDRGHPAHPGRHGEHDGRDPDRFRGVRVRGHRAAHRDARRAARAPAPRRLYDRPPGRGDRRRVHRDGSHDRELVPLDPDPGRAVRARLPAPRAWPPRTCRAPPRTAARW